MAWVSSDGATVVAMLLWASMATNQVTGKDIISANLEDGVSPWKCIQCYLLCHSKAVLVEHEQLQHPVLGLSQDVCRFCPAAFHHSDRLLCRLQKHNGRRTFNCFLCAGYSVSEQNLVCHVTTVHNDDADRLQCHLCLRRFSRKDALEVHIRMHRSDPAGANL
ncbi:hypothetical protein HPB49_023044 [Dermacentor silvarum]|uniref:Uncharacterized protein n=1 Tax=Dermacentor silvarum TaxID=543639 RepID=A0ACB8DRR9_DERSI|nr:hypothetical protein HPB49_023044 [Dermacentor silvarum]